MIYIEELKEAISQKKQSEIGRSLLAKGLRIEYGLSELPDIASGEFGKPYFPNYPDIHFNISHCDRAVVCFLSDKPVGIDVESIRKFDKELAEYILNPEEFESILKSYNPSLAFTIIWTRKESLCKLSGQGLNTREEIRNILTDLSVNFNTIIHEAGGYIITSCF